MVRNFAVIALALVLFSARPASADTYDDCRSECTRVDNECVNAITFYDPTGIQEAKNACTAQHVDCNKRCHDIEDLGQEGYEKVQKKEAEEAAKKREQQEIIDNGGIKIYKFND